jgi:hypothetical protein
LKLSKINIISCLGPPEYITPLFKIAQIFSVGSCCPGFTTEHDDTPHLKAKSMVGA